MLSKTRALYQNVIYIIKKITLESFKMRDSVETQIFPWSLGLQNMGEYFIQHWNINFFSKLKNGLQKMFAL